MATNYGKSGNSGGVRGKSHPGLCWLVHQTFSSHRKLGIGALMWLGICFDVWLQAQPLPFTAAYHAGLRSSDRFNVKEGAYLLQPNILPDLSGIVTSANVQSRYAGFGIFAMGIHLAGSIPGNFGAGISIQSIGNPDYRQMGISLSVGKKLSEKWGIGISQSIHRSRVGSESRPWGGSSIVTAGYNSGTWGISIRLAGLMPWNQVSGYHPFTAQIATYVKWPSRTQMFFLASYEAQDHRLYPVIGIRQTVMEEVIVFGAFQLYPARYGIGLSLPLTDRLRSVVSTAYHPVLGWSPAVGISWHTIKAK